MLDACFVWSGRIGRLAYFGYSLLLVVVLTVVGVVLILPTRGSPNGMTVVIVILGLLVSVGIYAGFCLAVKRLHDINLSGWHYVWMFVLPTLINGVAYATHQPVLRAVTSVFSAAIGLYLLFWPGTAGENDYGYQP